MNFRAMAWTLGAVLTAAVAWGQTAPTAPHTTGGSTPKAGSQTNKPAFGIEARVVDLNDRPVKEVSIKGGGKSCMTDSGGRCTLNELDGNTAYYLIAASKSGVRFVEDRVKVNSPGQRTIVPARFTARIGGK